jgi:hypothetical protein
MIAANAVKRIFEIITLPRECWQCEMKRGARRQDVGHHSASALNF